MVYFFFVFLFCSVSFANHHIVEIKALKATHNLVEAPIAVSILDSTKIHTGKPGLSLQESLNYVPGVFVQNPYNYSQDARISIRGFGARSPWGIRGLKIIVDGIPATFVDGLSQLEHLDLNLVKSIELIRGPTGSLYGNAAGGLLIISTKESNASPFFNSNTITGAYGLLKQNTSISRSFKRFSYLLNYV